MDHAPPLIASRLSRRAISWLAVAVLVVTPFQALMQDSLSLYTMLVTRAVALTALLFAICTERVGPVNGGRIFLGIGLCDMVASAFVFHTGPDGVLVEAISYGTILSIFTLLIAPSSSRRAWSLAVTAVVVIAAAVRLIPGNELLVIQLIVIFIVHTAAVLALDVHAIRAEEAGAIDHLTGLVNRRPAIEEMTSSLVEVAEDARPSTVIVVDLDHFKQLNDTLGHEAGDDALRRVAATLSFLVRNSDTLCRWGGEEFLVLLRGAESEAATRLAGQMRTEIERLGVTASFGVAQAAPSDTVAEWVNRADTAMYVAKRNGRNQVVADDQLAASSLSDRT